MSQGKSLVPDFSLDKLNGVLKEWDYCTRFLLNCKWSISLLLFHRLWHIINNYWTRLNKISWFVSGEQINYLPKPNNWSARNRLIMIFTITEFNNCFIIRSPSRISMNVFGKWSDLPFSTQERSQKGEKRSFAYAWAEYYLQASDLTVGRHCEWADHYL